METEGGSASGSASVAFRVAGRSFPIETPLIAIAWHSAEFQKAVHASGGFEERTLFGSDAEGHLAAKDVS
jgi:hypothetical protein